MPFVSEKQRRYFHWAAKHGKGDITPEMASEWEAHTPKDKKLPEKVASLESFFDELQKIAVAGIAAD